MRSNNDEKLILKNNVSKIRKNKGLTQAEFCKMIGVSRQTVSYIETGEFCPSAKLAYIICLVLDTKFEDLFYLESQN